MQFLGFGNGKDGFVQGDGSTITYLYDAGRYAACTGTSGSNTLTSTLPAVAGDAIFIHQSSHASAYGTWEVAYALSSNGSTVTLTTPLVNTFASLAQAVIMPQYTGISLTGDDQLVAELGWNGTRGGIVPVLVNGLVSLGCNDLKGIRSSGTGYRGGDSVNGPANGKRGEGYEITGFNQQGQTAQYAGGGGSGNDSYGSGGGGAAVSGGTNGTSETHGNGGTAFQSDVDLDTLFTFGAGGGSGAAHGSPGISSSGWGGGGGGLIYLVARKIIVTGSNRQIIASGSDAGNGAMGSGDGAGGGGGSGGGQILIKTIEMTAPNGTIVAKAGARGTATGGRGYGGTGSDGVIRIETCVNFNNTTDPSASTSFGGKNYCGSVAAIL